MNSVSITFPKLHADQDLASQPDWLQPGPSATLPAQNAYDQVRRLTPEHNSTLFWLEQIDMSAFFVQDKTFFPGDVSIQEPGLLKCGPTSAQWNDQASVQVLDIISNVPLVDSSFVPETPVIDPFVLEDIFPGGATSTIDSQFIVFGRYHAYSADINSSFPGAMNLIRSSTFGGGLPTASDKLFCLRIVTSAAGGSIFPAGTAILEVPETTYTIRGVASDEGELERIYRLRQSYEQKQG
jgi:hypothetical protein